MATAAAGANDLECVLELAAEEACQALGASSLSISRFEPEQRLYRTMINVGELGPDEVRFPTEEVYEIDRFPAVLRMVETGAPYFNSLDDPDCDPAAARVLRKLGKASDLGVVIKVEGEHWGEIWATTTAATSPFRAEDVRFLEAIGGQLASTIARNELFSTVSRLAYEDPLTGLANRRALDERLERAVARFNGDGVPLSLLICDLDKLKAINDEHGHVAGDHALKAVAETLVVAAAEFPGAFVARLGGDEFCVVLEGRGPGAIEQVGATAQDLLAANDLEVSLSGGAATAANSPTNAAELLRAADTAQYVAKRRGGGLVCTAANVGEGQPAPMPDLPLGTCAERIQSATGELIARLDTELAGAPVLDRLEAVATRYTEAGNFGRWAISFAETGCGHLRDVSLGHNRSRTAGPRVAHGFDDYEQYELDDFPATARIVAAGSGSFVAHVDDPEADAAETALLRREGFRGVVAVAAGDEDGVYLVELVGDDRLAPFHEVETALRLMCRAAIPAVPHSRRTAERHSGHSRALELSLALADRLAEATTEAEICDAAAEELQRAVGCRVVHLVALEGDRFVLRAERNPHPTPKAWSQKSTAGLLGRALAEGGPVIAGDVQREPQYRATEATRVIQSELAVPVLVGGETWGMINLEDEKAEAFDSEDARVLEAVAAQIGGALGAIAFYEQLDRAYMGTAEALSAALEAKDSYTAEHSRSIADNAVAVGRRLGLGLDELRMLRYAAAFHDIGKIAISREILNKPGPLDATERREIEEHTLIGERILEPIEFLAPVRPVVRSAHERWDGGGYPDGLAGEAIPLGSRILFACDAYDAMTTDRPYRSAMPAGEALSEMRACAGTQFDPAVVEALAKVLEEAGIPSAV